MYMLAGSVVAIALAGQAAFSWIRPSLSEDSMVRSIGATRNAK